MTDQNENHNTENADRISRITDDSKQSVSRHAGDLSARDAYTLLLEDRNALLLDVRTEQELAGRGQPDIGHLQRRVLSIPWTDPFGNPNLHFADELAEAVEDHSTPLLVLCRSGRRSLAAARAAAAGGYRMAINVADGFEGPLAEDGPGTSAAGWQASGLPWKRAS